MAVAQGELSQSTLQRVIEHAEVSHLLIDPVLTVKTITVQYPGLMAHVLLDRILELNVNGEPKKLPISDEYSRAADKALITLVSHPSTSERSLLITSVKSSFLREDVENSTAVPPREKIGLILSVQSLLLSRGIPLCDYNTLDSKTSEQLLLTLGAPVLKQIFPDNV